MLNGKNCQIFISGIQDVCDEWQDCECVFDFLGQLSACNQLVVLEQADCGLALNLN